jgi:predicted helicase
LTEERREKIVRIESDHIDGTMSAPVREQKISWLEETSEPSSCKLLTNVRCLSEGVDVPALDAVLFLAAKNSQIDVVQSVGRVMRKAKNKNYGYIVIPIVIPSTVEPEVALAENERYRTVWSVLNALRAHDERFEAIINKIDLNKKKPDNIVIGAVMPDRDESGFGDHIVREEQLSAWTRFTQLQSALYARIVKKVGTRQYWEQWAQSVAQIAERQVQRIAALCERDECKEAFANFVKGLQSNINNEITAQDAIEMLSQHIITAPVFNALFDNYEFAKHNAVSVEMNAMLKLLSKYEAFEDTHELDKFYENVRMRVGGIDNAESKQHVILELYNTFFKTAFPKMAERLGIVYTPVEVVDFIIRSVNDILLAEFGRDLGSENVNILDPFTGTGTFITRILQSGLIDPAVLERKYESEIFANEIVLLAYYIAAVNIENVYHDVTGSKDYKPFEGICLTDTFQLGEGYAQSSNFFPVNSERLERQRTTPITVIIGNPPYSVGQKNANDNAQNASYPKLDEAIANTYAKLSTATNKNALYDSYIRAFRWATDRLGNHDGIIGFVSNGAWLDGNSTAGFRKSLENEFSKIYVFNLRGNARTSGELRRKEAGNIFESGSRTPVAITLLVKRSDHKGKAKIYYCDIGDYLSREQKLTFLASSLIRLQISNATLTANASLCIITFTIRMMHR